MTRMDRFPLNFFTFEYGRLRPVTSTTRPILHNFIEAQTGNPDEINDEIKEFLNHY